MSEPIDEEMLGMPESTAYALLAFRDARRAQLWAYVVGFLSGATFALLAVKLSFMWMA